jgi:hypothetical protein
MSQMHHRVQAPSAKAVLKLTHGPGTKVVSQEEADYETRPKTRAEEEEKKLRDQQAAELRAGLPSGWEGNAPPSATRVRPSPMRPVIAIA